MKHLTLNIFLLLSILTVNAQQVLDYNTVPPLDPSHVLDEKLTNISFAYSMRILVSDYNGPLIRLRRASDNAEQDFFHGDNDIVDIAAINTWRAGSNVFVRTWYDQSSLGRNAVQSIAARQPQFITNASRPYFRGARRSNDHLVVTGANLQILTNSGANATILLVIRGIQARDQIGDFGVSDWWGVVSTRIGSGNYIRFRPGNCCGVPNFLSYTQAANALWRRHTFVRGNTTSFVRRSGTQVISSTHMGGNSTSTNNFSILKRTGDRGRNVTRSEFAEMIMYNTDIPLTEIQEIENNQQRFWGVN